MKEPILVAGIGNIFFGDDAFGSEVARELMRHPMPEGVEVQDFGISGYDLAYALMDGRDAVLIDTVSRGQAPGTVFLIELDFDQVNEEPGVIIDAHSLNPVRVLQMVRSLGGRPGRLYLVGCEPSLLESEDGYMGLSDEVQTAVPLAITMIESVLDDLLNNRTPATSLVAVKEVT